MWLLYFILVCFGLTNILVYGSILNCVRPNEGLWGALFKCPMCMGFHVGWFVAMLMNLSSIIDVSTNIVIGNII